MFAVSFLLMSTTKTGARDRKYKHGSYQRKLVGGRLLLTPCCVHQWPNMVRNTPRRNSWTHCTTYVKSGLVILLILEITSKFSKSIGHSSVVKFVKKRYIHFNTTAHDFTTEIPDDPSLNNSILRSKNCPKLSKILTQNLIRLSMPNPGTDIYTQSDIYIQTRTVTSILNESSFLKTSITRFTMTWNFTRSSNTNIEVTL